MPAVTEVLHSRKVTITIENRVGLVETDKDAIEKALPPKLRSEIERTGGRIVVVRIETS